jgi:two-component sensor histidine kinase
MQLALAGAALGLATGLRLLVDGMLPPGFPFLTFFPAVLITLLFAGTRAGIVVGVLGGLIAWYLFIPPARSFGLGHGTLLALGFYALIVGTAVLFVAALREALLALSAEHRQVTDLARSRELMFAELQHRVSNNLATVAALLRMQAGRSSDDEVRAALTEAQQRISTVARLQRRLHSPDQQAVDVADFLRALAEDTVEAASTGRRIDLRLETQPLMLDRDRSIPLGLIDSELLMNAIEHGEAGGRTPEVRIGLTARRQDDGTAQAVTLDLADNGPGLPENFSLAESKSLGLSIAREFARQLGGELTLSNAAGGGTLSRLTFIA